MTDRNRKARLAGGLYLLAGGLGAFAELFVRGNLFIPQDPAATVQAFMRADILARAGIIADLGMAILYLVLVLHLYNFFKHVNRNYAVLMVGLVACSVPLICGSLVSQYAALHVANDASYLTVFSVPQIQALSYLMLKIQGSTYLFASVFFGLWLLPLGLLVLQSNLLPRVLGVLLVLACGAYLLEFVLVLFELKSIYFLFDVTMPVYAIAELGFIFWLLVFGVKEDPES